MQHYHAHYDFIDHAAGYQGSGGRYKYDNRYATVTPFYYNLTCVRMCVFMEFDITSQMHLLKCICLAFIFNFLLK